MVDVKMAFENGYNALPEAWRAWTKDFFDLKLAEGRSYGTLRDIAYTVNLFAVQYGCENPGGITQQKIVGFAGWLQQRYALISVRLHLAKLKHLLKFSMPDFEFPVLMLKKPTPRVLRSDLLSRDEISRLIDAAPTLKTKTLIHVLYDSSARNSEICTMRVKDVLPDKYGCRIRLTGKTGTRIVRLTDSSARLLEYLEGHPSKGDPEAWLFPGRSEDHLDPTSLWGHVRRCCDRAGIKKRVYPHLFRHSRATELSKILTRAEHDAFHGWTPGSKSGAVYTHLSGEDIDDRKLLAGSGIKIQPKEAPVNPLMPTECPRCHFVNPVGTLFCGRCSLALTDESVKKIDQEKLEQQAIVKSLLEDPAVQKAIEKWMEKKVDKILRKDQ